MLFFLLNINWKIAPVSPTLDVNSTIFCHSLKRDWALTNLHCGNNCHLLCGILPNFQYAWHYFITDFWDANYTKMDEPKVTEVDKDCNVTCGKCQWENLPQSQNIPYDSKYNVYFSKL